MDRMHSLIVINDEHRGRALWASLGWFDPGRQNQVKACAARRVVGGPQAAVMRFNDGTADGQSHTGPVNLRGKKRIEDLVRLLRGQPYAGIADADHKLLVFRSPRLDGKLARPIRILHRINAVTDEVHHD